MRHKISGRKLNRSSAHRKALFKNLAAALIKYEQITTTLPKAKDLRPVIEKMITIGKKGTLHARRQLISKLPKSADLNKIMTELPERYKERNGGYTRIIKKGYRYGDSAPMAIIEFIDRNEQAKSGNPVVGEEKTKEVIQQNK
ncbi:MAG: 50S ribosomal protein L17 [Alphaproteobacteria bacterium MarineAlpha9_Bin4]|nr:50S ribosomal protein L17 [Pelagibacterales bacterium]PPR27111.1 MAG: 50S ribosomal protein L17 [Alphaproteobacteria bacterium MarineAlpha9_Bin4]|tara:strand:+ start:715 stop:1143 length:429 start_codon:yes stop_codon:yes gene_type:complete